MLNKCKSFERVSVGKPAQFRVFINSKAKLH